MKTIIICEDIYEAQKLASLIFAAQQKETYIKKILNIIENEVIIAIKDESVHSILLKDATQVEKFADFIQSVLEDEHKITAAATHDSQVEIIKV